MAQVSYAYWAERLERFAKGDDEAVRELEQAQLSWQPGVAERISRRCSEGLAARLEEVRRRLQRDLDMVGRVADIDRAMIAARAGIAPLLLFCQLPSLPQDLQDHLLAELTRIVSDLQQSLERSVRPDSAIAAELAARIRTNALPGALATPNPALRATAGDGTLRTARVILI